MLFFLNHCHGNTICLLRTAFYVQCERAVSSLKVIFLVRAQSLLGNLVLRQVKKLSNERVPVA